jgi:hypothetical protein
MQKYGGGGGGGGGSVWLYAFLSQALDGGGGVPETPKNMTKV